MAKVHCPEKYLDTYTTLSNLLIYFKVHHQKHLQWAHSHQNWTLAWWKNSVRSHFLSRYVDSWLLELHLTGKVMAPGGTVGSRQRGGGNVMLWAMFPLGNPGSRHSCGHHICPVPGLLHPFMATVSSDGSGFFQQTNVPCHTAHIVLKWFKEHEEEFNVLSCLSDFLDLNLIDPLGMYWKKADLWWLHFVTYRT